MICKIFAFSFYCDYKIWKLIFKNIRNILIAITVLIFVLYFSLVEMA